VQLCQSRGYVAWSFLLIVDLLHWPKQGAGFTTFGVSNDRNAAILPWPYVSDTSTFIINSSIYPLSPH
jgi:hypothetical protein